MVGGMNLPTTISTSAMSPKSWLNPECVPPAATVAMEMSTAIPRSTKPARMSGRVCLPVFSVASVMP